jgi:hypothetical protein
VSALDLGAQDLRCLHLAAKDARALTQLANAVRPPGPLTDDRLSALTVALDRLASAAEAHDLAHPGNPCVWRLHGPDDEPSPILRIETARGPVSLDVRTIVGEVECTTLSHGADPTMPAVRMRLDSGGCFLALATEAEASAALDRIHAARVAHDDQHAEDRRTERLAEAVARGVAEELRAILPPLGQQLVSVVDKLVEAQLEHPRWASTEEPVAWDEPLPRLREPERPDLETLASRWLHAGAEYREAYQAKAPAAVVWVEDEAGALTIYTRGEHKHALLAAIGRENASGPFALGNAPQARPRSALYSTRQAIAAAGLPVTLSASEAVELLAAQRDENASKYLALLADFDRLRSAARTVEQLASSELASLVPTIPGWYWRRDPREVVYVRQPRDLPNLVFDSLDFASGLWVRDVEDDGHWGPRLQDPWQDREDALVPPPA